VAFGVILGGFYEVIDTSGQLATLAQDADVAAFCAVIPREGGESRTPRLLGSITAVSEYWIARFRGR
jgi:hypothetical protein